MSPQDYSYYSSGKILLGSGEQVDRPSDLTGWYNLQNKFIGQSSGNLAVVESVKEINKRYAEWQEAQLKKNSGIYSNKSKVKFDTLELVRLIKAFEDRWNSVVMGVHNTSAAGLDMPYYSNWSQDHKHMVEKGKSVWGFTGAPSEVWKKMWDRFYCSAERDVMSFQNYVDEKWRQLRGYDKDKSNKTNNNNEQAHLQPTVESDDRPKGTSISRDEREESTIKTSGGLHGDAIGVIRCQRSVRYSRTRATVQHGEYPESEVKISRPDKR